MQEEDFVTNTFHRSLLDEISTYDIQQVVTETLLVVQNSKDFSPDLLESLCLRLKFRRAYLDAVSTASERSNDTTFWQEMLDCLPRLEATVSLGLPVAASFSTKLQRKLASTVPPRPMVEIDQKKAYKHLERLCYDGKRLMDILNFFDSESLMVSA